MASLFGILNNSAATLSAQTAAEAVTSNNLQNVNTPGYARQRATLEPLVPSELVNGNYIGTGATLGPVTQVRDGFVEAQLPAAFGNAANSSAASDVLGGVDALNPQASGGLTSSLSSFYSSLTALSQNASDPSLRQSAVAAAQSLARSFQQTRSSLEDARTGCDQRIAGDVSEANGLTAQVASLNLQIRSARAAGSGEPNDLLDARQNDVDRLAELTGASPITTSEGDVTLVLPGGAGLVTSLSASPLSATPDPNNGGHLTLSISEGGSSVSTTPGGEIGGLLQARDSAIGTAVGSLDTMAFDLAGAVNSVHQGGFDLDGNAGQPLFEVATSAGAASQIAVNADITADPNLLATRQAGGGTGDASNVLALLGTESTALSSGKDAATTLSQLTSDFGTQAQNASAASDADSAMKSHLVTLRQSASGVSSDDELVDMQKNQQAYSAVAKVISTTSAMLDTLLQIT